MPRAAMITMGPITSLRIVPSIVAVTAPKMRTRSKKPALPSNRLCFRGKSMNAIPDHIASDVYVNCAALKVPKTPTRRSAKRDSTG